jgi:hypothetical protein
VKVPEETVLSPPKFITKTEAFVVKPLIVDEL